MKDSENIHVSVREGRMAVERILLTCGLPPGYVPAVRECVLLSQSLGLGGFETILNAHSLLAHADLSLMQAADAGKQEIDFDSGGLHAWIVLPTVMDLATATARKYGHCEVRVRNVLSASELQISSALALRLGASAQLTHTSDTAVISICNAGQPRNVECSNPLLWEAIQHGWRFDRARWRDVYTLSNQALAPDSVVSRRHAGPVVVDAAGQVVGRVPVDDETDLRTLTQV